MLIMYFYELDNADGLREKFLAKGRRCGVND